MVRFYEKYLNYLSIELNLFDSFKIMLCLVSGYSLTPIYKWPSGHWTQFSVAIYVTLAQI